MHPTEQFTTRTPSASDKTDISMSQVVVGQVDKCLGKRSLLQLHLGPPSPPSPPPKRICTMAETASLSVSATAATTTTNTNTAPTTTTTTANTAPTTAESSAAPSQKNIHHYHHHLHHHQTQTHNHQKQPAAEWDPTSWDTNLVPSLNPSHKRGLEHGEDECLGKSADESYKRALDHFPNPAVLFPTPSLEFDFRVAVALKPEPSQVQGRSHKEITAVSSGSWSGSFGHGKIMAGGYDLGQARGFRPIRIVEGAFIMQTTDESPATLEMRTRGSLSGPCDILDALLSPRNPKQIDPRKYGFRMFLTIKTADKRYAEIVNCGLWVASGVWKDDELIIDAYRVT